jgi:hypothetical protein
MSRALRQGEEVMPRKKAVELPDGELQEEEVIQSPFLGNGFDYEKFAKVLAKHTGIDYSQLGAAIGLALVEGLRAKDEDPEKVRIKKMRREQMRETQREAMSGNVDKWLACSHMRTHPYSGTARIAWAQQSDGLTRGTCMGCGCLFTPVESELPDPKRMKALYEKYRGMPVSIAHNDFLSGMVVAGQPA